MINNLSGQINTDSLKAVLQTVSGNKRIEVLNKLAKAYLKTSPEKAIEYGKQALELSIKINDEKEEVNALTNIGDIYQSLFNYNKALEYYLKSLKINEENGDKKGVADALNNIGNVNQKISNYDEALEYYLKSLKIREEIGNKKDIANSLNNIGRVYWRLGNYDKALKYHLTSLKIRKEIRNKKDIAVSLKNIGNVYWNLSNYDKALEYYLKSLKIGEEIKDNNVIANALNNIGIIYYELSNYDKALEYWLESLKINEEIGNKKSIANSLNNVGVIYKILNNYDKAIEYHFKSLKIKKEIGDKNGIAYSLQNIGEIYYELSNYDKALEFYLRSLKIKKEIGNKKSITITLRSIGNLYLKLKNYDKAFIYLEQSLKLAKEIESKGLIKDSYESFSNFYAAKSNYKKGLEYYKLYSEVKDSIFTKESSEKIAEMQTKYETEKKEKEIEILTRDKEIQILELSRQKLLRNSFIGGFGFILILAFVIYNRYRLKNEANRQLTQTTGQLKMVNTELNEAKKETDNILQNVEEGFFLLNSAFEIGSQYSRSLIIILEDKDLAYKNFIKMLKQNIPAKIISSTEEYLELMFNDDIDEETLKDLNPLNKIELNFKNIDGRWVASKHLSFKFKRITDYKNKTTGIIVTVTDITDKIHLAKQLKESEAHTKQQIEWMVNILHVEPELLREFMEGGRKELNYIEDLLKQDKTENDYITSLENIYRSMHLIKGNASLLDLKFFVKKTHKFEDEIAKIKEKTKIESSDFVPLVLQLNEMQKTLDELNDLIERISYIHTQFRPKRSYENKLFIQSIQNFIENLAKDLGKEIKFIHNKFDAGVVPYHYRLLSKEILIQLARNSVFHGIESADERIKLNKEPYGTIEISSFIKNNKFGFTFRDDGRGLQIEKLRKKAKEFGKWDNAEIDRWDDKQTADVIFTQGISTSEKAELAAGRGVGMDIIKQKLRKNDGQIKTSFSKGKFCEFEISLPVKKKNIKDKTKKVRVADM
jgi:tetratricopeptide (TPR) repeat protein